METQHPVIGVPDLPPYMHYPEILTLAEMEIVEVIKGVLHLTTKMSIGGGSKSKKSWLLTDLALAVAHGTDWLGFKTTQVKVLYINLEIPPIFFAKRLASVSKLRNLPPLAATMGHMLTTWSLRGFNRPYSEIIPKIIERCRFDGFGLIIIDPVYKLLGDADENKAHDIAQMLNAIERISHETGAAVLFAAHFSKGNQSKKEAIDRVSGSGVFARDPDTIMTMTEHEEQNCFTCEFVTRSLPDIEPFVVEWSYPLLNRVGLDPGKLRQERGGRPPLHDLNEVLELLETTGMTGSEWQSECEQALSMKSSTFQRIRKELLNRGLVSREGKTWSPNLVV